jgi:hypothetical protein
MQPEPENALIPASLCKISGRDTPDTAECGYWVTGPEFPFYLQTDMV